MGCVQPQVGYLEHLRELCDRSGALLIFDEVMTGFRVAYGGAAELYAVLPDLTCLGKILGGGLPCAAYGGREELMRRLAPDGPTYQAGTLSGNPLAMAAGIATLQTLRDGQAYARLEQTGAALAAGLNRAAEDADVPMYVSRVGSMVGCFFTGDEHRGTVVNYEQAAACDPGAFALFFNAMLDRGVLLPPSQFETWFISTAHDEECIEQTVAAAFESFKVVASAHRSESTVA
jgi:glutamate-1-semialdehyde 2,1-aminomutase